MIELIYLAPGERPPELLSGELWLTIEASNDGRFVGTGLGRETSGENVAYNSLVPSNLTLMAAIGAATDWANNREVPHIWVQTTPA